MAVRVEDGGESKGQAVTVWIRGRHNPTRKRADFPLVFHHERTWQIGQQGQQMTAQAGAALDRNRTWETLSWATIEGEVRRLQARIVKAVQQGRWNKAKALQHLLTRSANGKLLAARRVTENDGRKTPGVDSELWDSSQKKLAGAMSLTRIIHEALEAAVLQRDRRAVFRGVGDAVVGV